MAKIFEPCLDVDRWSIAVTESEADVSATMCLITDEGKMPAGWPEGVAGVLKPCCC